MTWAQRLKRVFLIDASVCGHCGGAVKIIACIQDKLTIAAAGGPLAQLVTKAVTATIANPMPNCRLRRRNKRLTSDNGFYVPAG